MNSNSTSQTNQVKQSVSSIRDGIGRGLVELGKSDNRVVVLCADLTESTRTHWFAKEFPDRFIQVGVAEQNMAGIAAGLAATGKLPFIASYAVFNPGLNWGIIRSSICYSNLPVTIIGGHAGLATGADGATHQALEDIAIMRSLPNMRVLTPSDGGEAKQLVAASVEKPQPTYIRNVKPDSKKIPYLDNFQIGSNRIVKNGTNAVIFAHGLMVEESLEASKVLESKGIDVGLVAVNSIKPLDTKGLSYFIKQKLPIFVVEDHQASGGLGSSILEYVSQLNESIKIEIIAMNDNFGESGSKADLYKKYEIDSISIVQIIEKAINKLLLFH